MQIDQVGGVRCALGEGPVWDTLEQALYFVDVTGRRIWRYAPAQDQFTNWRTPSPVGSLALREQGGAVLALDNGFHLFDFQSGTATLINDPQAGSTLTQFNDGKTDRRGRFFAGTVHKPASEPHAALYRMDPDHSVTQVESGIIVSNGPCWSPDESVFYFADSMRHAIYAYDYDPESGTVANRREFARTDALGGIPDGATVDCEGRLWSAICNAGKVVCYRPDGAIEAIIEVPPKLVSSVMFGGSKLDQLYCTSIDAATMPAAFGCDASAGGGELFVVTGLGVTGLPERRFAG